MPPGTYSADVWPAPHADGRLAATVRLPGSKSLTNRELVLSALADGPSRLRGVVAARDTTLMVEALRSLGTGVDVGSGGDEALVTPGPLRGGAHVDVGLAGTVMRFLPPVAALADGPVSFDGDERARHRPTATTILSLRALGVAVDDGGRAAMPFTVAGTGRVRGGRVELDASASSQFVSGLLLAGPRFEEGLEVEHLGDRLPSLPHIEMTVDVLRQRGVPVEADVDGGSARWSVGPHPIRGRDVVIEPDLSNAAPFLAAALVAGGTVTVPDWPARTTQSGERLRELLPAFGGSVHRRHDGLTADGGAGVVGGERLRPIDLDLGDVTELVPTLAGLAALADGTSTLTGIAHMRGHETDRLAALAAELRNVGARVDELADGLVVTGGAVHAGKRPWRSYADHRIATTGALVGLAAPGLRVEDIGTTAKTLPDFPGLWGRMLG